MISLLLVANRITTHTNHAHQLCHYFLHSPPMNFISHCAGYVCTALLVPPTTPSVNFSYLSFKGLHFLNQQVERWLKILRRHGRVGGEVLKTVLLHVIEKYLCVYMYVCVCGCGEWQESEEG